MIPVQENWAAVQLSVERRRKAWLPGDTEGWETVEQAYDVPDGATNLIVTRSMRHAKGGTADFRNLQVTLVRERTPEELQARQRQQAEEKAQEKVRFEEREADVLRDSVSVAFAHPAFDGVMQCGFWAGKHGKPTAALWRKDWEIKPNGETYIDLVCRQWWTDQTL